MSGIEDFLLEAKLYLMYAWFWLVPAFCVLLLVVSIVLSASKKLQLRRAGRALGWVDAGIFSLYVIAIVIIIVSILNWSKQIDEELAIKKQNSPEGNPNTIWRCEENDAFFVVDSQGNVVACVPDKEDAGLYRLEWYYQTRGATRDAVHWKKIGSDGESPWTTLDEFVEYDARTLSMTYYPWKPDKQIFGPAEGEVTLHFYLAEELPGPVSFTDTGYILGDGTEVPWVEHAG